MPLIIIVLGVLGITVDLIFLIAFIVVVGYYLYRMDKRISELEGSPGGQKPPAK